MAKKKKKKLNIKRTLAFLLFIYIFCYGVYYLVNQPIKHIEINGNNLVLDSEILRVSKLKDYPSIFKCSSKTLEKRIKSIKLVDEVDVKKWFGHVVKIEIIENKVLFYYQDKIVLSNGNFIKNDLDNIYGIPTFVNDIKTDILNKFIEGFSKLEDNIIYEMNEIEYYPLTNESNKVIDEDRFKITMNDGNTIITNSKSVNVLNKYNDIYASLGGKLGTINLDTNEINNLIFIPYGE